MVAGADSCACEQCGTVCRGRFPACDEVWARGPRQVTLVRPVHAVRVGGTGSPAAVAALGPGPEQMPGSDPVEEADSIAVTLEGLRAELRELRDLLARQQELLDERAAADLASGRLVALVESLPGSIGTAVSRALARAAGQGDVVFPPPPSIPPPTGGSVAEALPEPLHPNGGVAGREPQKPSPPTRNAPSHWESLKAYLAPRQPEPPAPGSAGPGR